ncbi:MAG: MarR family transcriptional regulator [Planctomycetota bacterium]
MKSPSWSVSPPEYTPEQEAYVELVKTHEQLAAGASAFLKEHAISQPQMNVLRTLRRAEGGELPCQALAGELINRVPDVTRLVDRLEQAGLVQRRGWPEDRRVVLISLTAKGRRFIDKLYEPLQELHRDQLGHLSARELSQLVRLLKRVRGEG